MIFNDLTVRTAAGKRLRAMRNAACLSQEEVARRTLSHRPIISRIERGVHAVSLHVANRFALACGGTLHDVLQAVDEALAKGGAA